MRSTKIILSLVLLFTATAIAGSDKPKPTCNDCDTKLAKCADACKEEYKDPTAYTACAQHACICEVGKDEFCRGSCGIGGAGSLCFYD